MHPTDGGPVARRWNALRRGARVRAKRALRRPVDILVDIRWRLGDEIMAIPVYESIKQIWRDSSLTVMCTYPELLENNPHVDRVTTDADAAASCDLFIDLRDASRTVQRQTHYARRANVPAPQSRPRVYWDAAQPCIEMDDANWIAVSTGATWAAKRWPLPAWKALCQTFADRGYRVVQVGRGDERIGLDHDLDDRTTVREAGEVLRRCALFVGCDSGLLHLAAAVGTPSIGLFGPTDPYVVFDERDPMTPITNARPCAPCWNGPLTMREPGVCPRQIDSCLEPIGVDAVLDAAFPILERTIPADRCA